MFILKKFFNTKTSPIKATYDSYNQEVLQVITPNFFKGLRVELSKTILPFLQVSNVKSLSTNQTFFTMSSKNSIFQFSMDNNRNFQLKTSHLTGPIVSKFHSIVSREKEVFNQAEAILSSTFYNIAFKLVSPAFEASNLIYIINYFATIKCFSFGAEAVGLRNEVGLSFSTRLESGKSIYGANLQRFNQLTLNYYRKIKNIFEVGAELKKTKENLSYIGGIRVKNQKSEVKCTYGSDNTFNFYWNEGLTENLKIEFASVYDWEDFEYGISLIYED